MKNDCDVVRDLLPNYIAGFVSNNTNEFIKEHIASCQQCNLVFQSMKKGDTKDKKSEDEQVEINHLKKYRKHMSVLKMIIAIIIIIIIAFPILVTIKYNKNSNITNLVVSNIEKYKNSDNYCMEIKEYQINYDTQIEDYTTTKYFYKDGKYKEERHSESSNVVIENADTFEYGEINSNEKIKIIENQKVAYNIKANYNFVEKGKFFKLILDKLDVFSKDFGTLPNIFFRMGYKLRTDRYNGRECYVLEKGDKSSYRELWIDKEKNMLIRCVEECYNKYYRENVYVINFDGIMLDDVIVPDLTGYTIKNDELIITNEYINLYEQLNV